MLLVGWVAVVVTALLVVVLADLTAYLLAAARAQGAADAAALAAIPAAHPEGGAVGDPVRAARRIAEAWGAELRRCHCRRGDPEVAVEVAVAVPAVVVTRWFAHTVVAEARATMVEVGRSEARRR